MIHVLSHVQFSHLQLWIFLAFQIILSHRYGCHVQIGVRINQNECYWLVWSAAVLILSLQSPKTGSLVSTGRGKEVSLRVPASLDHLVLMMC